MYNYTSGFELYEVYVDWQLIILKKTWANIGE